MTKDEAINRYRIALLDAQVMFMEIEKARQLPAFGSVHQQYIATGHEIKRLLSEPVDAT